ncbi:hypothetical protein Tco_1441482, partial [Tanacetum coccineum]
WKEKPQLSGVRVFDAPLNGPAGKAVTIEVLCGNHVVRIHVVLEPKPDEPSEMLSLLLVFLYL